jgi:hypothetical protein
MAYFQDGTQLFGIPASPLTINSVTYIAEDISFSQNSKVVEIMLPDGSPSGQVIVLGNSTGTAKLQFATYATPVPPGGATFTMFGSTWYVTSVSPKYSQGAYAYVDIGLTKQIVP